MNPKSKILFTLTFATAVGSVAMAEDSIPIRYTRPMRNTVSVGIRMISSGAHVKFSNLGNISSILQPFYTLDENRPYYYNSDAKAGFIDKDTKLVKNEAYRPYNYYDNGAIAMDAMRSGVYSEYLYNNALNTPGPDTSKPLASGTRYFTKSQSWVFTRGEDGNYLLTPEGNLIRIYKADDISGTGYETTTNIGNVDYLAYKDGQTRAWQTGQANGAQIQADGVHFNRYSVASLDDSRAQREASSEAKTGFEIEIDHIIRKESLRFEWGVKFGLGFSFINAKDSGNVRANLVNQEDVYDYAAGYSRPVNATDSTSVTDYGLGSLSTPVMNSTQDTEVTVPLSLTPNPLKSSKTWSEIDVKGFWQIKGGYYIARLGPSARYYLSPRLSFSGSAGLAGALFGTTYRVNESYTLTSTMIGTAKELIYDSAAEGEGAHKRGLTAGYFAQLNAEWWLTPSTGFYAGVGFEKLGSYNQSVKRYEYDQEGKKTTKVTAIHTSHVDIGQGAVFRLGINTRF